MDFEPTWWHLAVVVAPILAPFLAVFLFNGFLNSRRAERRGKGELGPGEGTPEWRGCGPRSEFDHRMTSSYRTWSTWIRKRGSLPPVSYAHALEPGEICFACEYGAMIFETVLPHPPLDLDALDCSSECGEPVGEGWTVLEDAGEVQFIGVGVMLVTNRNIYLKKVRGSVKIPLRDLRLLDVACSSLLLEEKEAEHSRIVMDVNGQILRDTILMLIEEAENQPWQRT